MTRGAAFVLESEAGEGIVYIWPSDRPFPITREADGQYHFGLRFSSFPFASIVGVRGLTVEVEAEAPRWSGDPHPRTVSFRCYGVRSLDQTREDGYDLRGRVKIGGRRARAFTSNILLRLEGKLESVPVLYACRPAR